MATHHILCIHGIGSHTDDWVKKKEDGDTQTFEELFKEKWDKYPKLGKFAEKVQLHSIHYDDEIEKIFKSWQQQAEELKTALASSPVLQGEVSSFTDAVDKATAAQSQGNWRYTHLMDLLMFVGSPTIQDRLVTYVGHQLIDLIKAHSEKDDLSVIAHSMGCAMAHKAIQALYNEGVEMPDGSRQTLKGDFTFVHVSMVANTSYSLSRDRKSHYDSIVRPSSKVGDGCCFSWINVNHQLDPVGRFMPFDHRKNPQWLDPIVESGGSHKDIALTRISSKDIHSLNHYFRDPSFHLAFLGLAFGASFTEKQRRDAIEDFVAQTPEGKFKALKAHLESDALNVSNVTSFKKFIQALRDFLGLTK